MKSLVVLALLFSSTSLYAQKLRFKVDGQKDTTVHLVKYFGKGLYYADTAEMKSGYVEFNGAKQKTGILALFLPGQQMLEFVYNGEEIHIETALPDLMGNAKIKKSEENKIFFPYVKFISEKRSNASKWTEERKAHKDGSENYKRLTEQIDLATKEVVDYQANIVKSHSGMLVGKVVKMSMDVEIPEAPKDETGKMIDSNFRFLYFRSHFWDNIDLNDDRLVRTPVFHNKLQQYFSNSMMVQHWDTVLNYAIAFCDRLPEGTDMYQYCVSWLTSTYEKSNIMGMDKVFVLLGERYYCSTDANGKSKAFWLLDTEDKRKKLDDLCDKVTTHKNLIMGAVPPNIILRDTTDVNWVDFYSLEKEYTVLYFWDPECGHCKKITPKLQTLYEKKFRDRNIEIFAVGKAVGDDFEKWKKFVRVNNLEFINVAVTNTLYTQALEDARRFVPKYTTLESLNYQQAYDIYATPKMWVLDKDKKIIAKSLTISQLEDLMDRLQNVKDVEKLFPAEDNKEEEQMH
jgi:thiol-disulfide isomerase/thioredoxin